MNKNFELDIDEAQKLEQKHVYEIYDKIASDFSDSRFRAWPNVKEFIFSLPVGSFLLDTGTGNGKNLNLNKNIFSIGCDTSFKLLEICRKKNLECLTANVLNLPFKSESFDACIFIAVLHHLSTNERRLIALNEIVNLLKVGGQCLTYVWAFEQELNGSKSDYIKKKYEEKTLDQVCVQLNLSSSFNENNKRIMPIHYNGTKFRYQDIFVPWKKKNQELPLRNQDLRYYHLFKENELDDLINKISNVKIKKSYYDNGNWAVLFEKISLKSLVLK